MNALHTHKMQLSKASLKLRKLRVTPGLSIVQTDAQRHENLQRGNKNRNCSSLRVFE